MDTITHIHMCMHMCCAFGVSYMRVVIRAGVSYMRCGAVIVTEALIIVTEALIVVTEALIIVTEALIIVT